ncbi:MAG: YhjD/YihY/BrkB family envelope integrity protein [Pseudomonadota bacterium]
MAEGTLPAVLRYFRRILREDPPTLHTGVRAFHYLVRLGTHVVLELNEAQFLQRASALAYTTILSLVPVTALFVLYFKMAGKLASFSSSAQDWILRTFVADSAQGVVDYIDRFVANLHTRTLGTIGAAGLIFTAYSLLRTVEKSLNALWKVRRHRTIWARFQMLCSILVVVPTALAASLYVSGRVQELKFFHSYRDLTTMVRTAFVLVPILLTTFSLFMLFKLMPNTKVRWKPALFSALVAAVLFELAKGGFNLYVLKVIPVSKVYGSLGLIPVLLLWIYLSWVIVLTGVELNYTIQNLAALQREMREKYTQSPFAIPVHEDWGIRIAVALARHFLRGDGPQSAVMLAADVGLPIESVEDHLGVLTKAQLVAPTAIAEEPSYVFSRPPEKITIGEIGSAFRAQLSLPAERETDHQRTLSELIR